MTKFFENNFDFYTTFKKKLPIVNRYLKKIKKILKHDIGDFSIKFLKCHHMHMTAIHIYLFIQTHENRIRWKNLNLMAKIKPNS